MRQYQEAQLTDLSGGLTDNYIEDMLRFIAYRNFIPTDNKSAKLRAGHIPYDYTNPVGAIQNVNAMIDVKIDDGTALVASVGRAVSLKYRDGFKIVESPDSNNFVFDNIDSDSVCSIERWNDTVIINSDSNDKPARVTIGDTGNRAQQASLPEVASVTTSSATGDRLYVVCITREYTTASGYKYREYSPEHIGTCGDALDITAVEPAITGLDKLFQDELKYSLFVTLPNGTLPYLVIETDTATSLDYSIGTTTDTDLAKNEAGFFFSEVAKIEIPTCKHMFQVNNTFYYANITTDTEEYSNRIYQAVPGMPTSVISAGYTDLDGEIYGGGEANGVPIVLTEKAVYRLDGVISVDGTGDTRPVKISGSKGGISNRSVVTTDTFAYYAGRDGFYKTDGYSAVNISSSSLYKTYISLTKDKKKWKNIQGSFDRDNNFIRWNMSNGVVFLYNITTGTFSEINVDSSLGDVRYIHNVADSNNSYVSYINGEISRDITTDYIVLDVDSARQYNVDSMVIISDQTTIYEGEIVSIDSTSIPDKVYVTVYFSEQLLIPTVDSTYSMYLNSDSVIQRTYYCMESGVVKYSDDTVLHDSVDDLSITDYDRKSIDFDILTSGISYGAKEKKKWVKSFTTNIQASSNVAMTPYVICDDNGDIADMALITNKQQFRAFDSSDINKRSSQRWFPDAIVRKTRHLPRGFNYCWYNQVGLRSADVSLYDSIDYQTATVSAILDKDDPLNPTGFSVVEITIDTKDDLIIRFPRDIIDNTIAISPTGANNFASPVKITDLNDTKTVITAILNSKLASLLEVGSQVDWIIYGTPIDQAFELSSFVINYSVVSAYGAGANRSDDSGSKYE